jgi:hypothetical protein
MLGYSRLNIRTKDDPSAVDALNQGTGFNQPVLCYLATYKMELSSDCLGDQHEDIKISDIRIASLLAVSPHVVRLISQEDILCHSIKCNNTTQVAYCHKMRNRSSVITGMLSSYIVQYPGL